MQKVNPARGGANVKKYKILLCFLLAAALSLALFSSCRVSSKSQDDEILKFTSYRDIPGILQEEIDLIEAFRNRNASFIYGMIPSSESFYNTDGEIEGYAVYVSSWLSELFDIEFIPRNYTWEGLLSGLESGDIHFSGHLMSTEERQKTFFMTDPIAHRKVKYFRLENSPPLAEIRETRLPQYALVSGGATTTNIINHAQEAFEAVFVPDYIDAYDLLKSGEADAFVAISTAQPVFESFGDVVTSNFLPLIYSTASFSTRVPELEVFVNVVQKALENNAINHLNKLYRQGEEDYKRHNLYIRLTEEEREFIKNNEVIEFAAEFNNYPLSIYDARFNQWKGISFDVLKEIEILTGLVFKPANPPDTEWPDLLKMLEAGDAQFVTELVYTEDRERRFIWAKNSIMTDHPALISKAELPNITNLYDVYSMRIGIGKDLALSEMFLKWFPNHQKVREFDGLDLAYDALAQDEIDMVMHRGSGLLRLTHFLETPGYKANIIFDYRIESQIGFNKNALVLRDIIDKALKLIDTELISEQWNRKTYDYRAQVAEAQRPWIIGVTGLLLFILILVFILFRKSRHEEKRLEALVKVRTAELKILARDAEAATKAKTEFLAVMSHEIRTPMNSIMGFAELALDSDSGISPKVKDYLRKIKDSTKWLLNIINDVLDISKIESGKMELENTAFDLKDVFSRCQSVILPDMQKKGLELRVYAEPLLTSQSTESRKLLGDPLRLYQVLLNLLSNAVKFTDRGIIKLSSALKESDENKAKIYFEVSDTGIGMTPEQTAKIFEAFVQADSSTTRNYGGTGLGLSITKNIIEMMGGKLSVESAEGAGSIFSFEIVFETIVTAGGTAENTTDIPSEKPHFNGLILICDDNYMNQQVICEHLANLGLETITADNGKIGVEKVCENIKNAQKGEKIFDLIFMDIFMPVMDGIEASSEIMKLNTGIPIIAMTANVMSGEIEKYKRYGMSDYLGKPFTSQELWQTLLKYLTPVEVSSDFATPVLNDNELQHKWCALFIKNNHNKYFEITQALNTGDIKSAHRMAHTLKGNAGQIKKTELHRTAEELEDLLGEGKIPSEEKLLYFKNELEKVIEELKPLLAVPEPQEQAEPLSGEQIRELFNELEALLESRNTECMSLVDKIRAIPEAEELIWQIEDFDYEAALITLNKLKEEARN